LRLNQLVPGLRFALLPLLAAVYPAIFLYSNNVSILTISSLISALILYAGIALIVYGFFLLVKKFDSNKAAIAAFVFLVFFHIYGILFNRLLLWNKVQIEHYTFLPLVILAGIYAALLVVQLKPSYLHTFWKGSVVVLGVLIVFNLVTIIPAELEKRHNNPPATASQTDQAAATAENHPDIYYIIFDEFAGFDAMRKYWKYNGVDQFVGFLKAKGFFVAENSRSSSLDTLHQLSTRLNYQPYPLDRKYQSTYFDDIADSRVARYLKERGYSIVVFDETRASFAYPAKPPVIADYSFEFDPETMMGSGGFFDDFGILVANNTMVSAFSNLYDLNNPVLEQHKNMINFTVNKLGNLNEVPTPKFVYVHLMVPHMPFMFDENGNYVDQSFHSNWSYYLGNYIYTTRIAEKMIDSILSNADPENPPVIILQSDHGARNNVSGNPNSVPLENYPEEYKRHIMFTMYMAGHDFSKIPQDIDPINTFPIVFNYLFDAGIPLQ
jgi:hypothetical protein